MRTLLSLLLAAVPAAACNIVIMGIDKGPLPTDWKRGQIVEVLEDGRTGGDLVKPPKFLVIQLPGVPKAEAVKWLKEHRAGDGTMLARREYRVRVEELPEKAVDALVETGMVVAETGKLPEDIVADVHWDEIKTTVVNDKTAVEGVELGVEAPAEELIVEPPVDEEPPKDEPLEPEGTVSLPNGKKRIGGAP